MRHIILHHHIFKNAGTTLDFALAAQFGPGFMLLENGGNTVPDTMLAAFLERHPETKAISSHHFLGQGFEPALQNCGCRAFHFALVRRPLSRLLSMYKYYRKFPPEDDLASLANQLDVSDFILNLIDIYPYIIDNPQVNTFSNNGFYRCATSEDDLGAAWCRYKTFSLCAPVERYDEAMVVLEYFNSPVYRPKGLNLAYIHQNISDKLVQDHELAKIISRKTFDLLQPLNALDNRLWELADAELDRRIARVPDFGRRLTDFQDRCRRLVRCSEKTSEHE